MRNLFVKLWADDAGLLALEYLGLLTIIGLGLVVGFAAVEGALNVELTETADAILAFNQSYGIKTQSHCKAYKLGWSVSDTPGSINYTSFVGSNTTVDQIICTP